jgi:hypothetical protein
MSNGNRFGFCLEGAGLFLHVISLLHRPLTWKCLHWELQFGPICHQPFILILQIPVFAFEKLNVEGGAQHPPAFELVATSVIWLGFSTARRLCQEIKAKDI